MNNEELNLPTSYEQAFNELQKIVSEIEQLILQLICYYPKCKEQQN